MPVFLFTDIEESTKLWEQHSQAMGQVLARHDAILQELISQHGGKILRHRGDGFSAVFEAGAPLDRNLSQVAWQQFIGDAPYRETCPDLPPNFTLH
jgi:class 3 adenylate cyclase